MRARGSRLLLILSLFFLSPFSSESLASQLPSGLALIEEKIKDSESLSSYLSRSRIGKNGFFAGLLIQTPETHQQQIQRQRRLVTMLSVVPNEGQLDHIETRAKLNFSKLLGGQDPVGRIVLPSTDAAWLQVNVGKNPRLKASYRVYKSVRPTTVTVVKNNGELCQIPYAPEVESIRYVKLCEPKGLSFDDGYLIQPDGRIELIGVGEWNRTAQEPAAPGAWIWFPARQLRWPAEFNTLLVGFLSGQGPAHDRLDSVTAISETNPPHHAQTVSRGLVYSPNNRGMIGLLQTPTARFPTEGTATIGFAKTTPNSNLNLTLSPFNWLEFGLRYTDFGDEPYYKSKTLIDKGMDVKFQVFPETRYLPQIAVGLQDIGGTGLFSAEYLVTSKRWNNFDTSLGIGWGYFAKRDTLKNPLSELSSHFSARGAIGASQGGTFNTKAYFTGPVSFFGGIHYRTPWDPLSLKLEYDSNHYQSEPFGKKRIVESPWNGGLVFQIAKYSFLTLGYERGNTFMFNLSLGQDLRALATPKNDDPPRLPIAFGYPTPDKNTSNTNWKRLTEIFLKQVGWHVVSIDERDNQLRLILTDVEGEHIDYRIERANRVLHRYAPISIEEFSYVISNRSMNLAELIVNRRDWIEKTLTHVPPEHGRIPWRHDEFTIPSVSNRYTGVTGEPIQRNYDESRPIRRSLRDKQLYQNEIPFFMSQTGINLANTIGGIDRFSFYRIFAYLDFEFRPRKDTWLHTSFHYKLSDNFGAYEVGGNSNLPPVRTNLREYSIQAPRATIPLMQINHVRQISDNFFGHVYGGLIEYSFSGIGTELLYRPHKGQYAFGIDYNQVRQRDYQQRFGQFDYRVTTGHATLYWDLGYQNILAKLSAGQYLAGDRGITLDLSRDFDNGLRIGAWITKTNVSAEQFGEGSFDKGVYISVPFDIFLTKSSIGRYEFLWRPLTRDGGAKLFKSTDLFTMTKLRGNRATEYHPPTNRIVD